MATTHYKHMQKLLEKALLQKQAAKEAKRQLVQPEGSDSTWVKQNDLYVSQWYIASSKTSNFAWGKSIFADFVASQEVKPRPTSTEPSERLTQLIGWRQWRLRDGKLWSTAADCCWEGPTLSAGKPALDGEERVLAALGKAIHPTPDPTVGIMAYKNASDLITFNSDIVAGSVYLWGSVAEHTQGYRAERATVRSLLVHPEAADQIEALQSRYQPEAIGIYRSFADQLEAL